MYINNSDSSDLDMLESMSYSIFNYWEKRELHINTYFAVTGCMLCVIPQKFKDESDHSESDHRKQVFVLWII